MPPLIFIALALAGADQPAPPPQARVATSRHGRIFISPMGEPFQADGGVSGLAAWFAQADANHDGALTVGELAQDGARFFATLDLNHDGRIDPDEVSNYENEVAPFAHVGSTARAAVEEAGPASDDADEHQMSDSIRHRLATVPQGAGRFGLLNIPEPVAAADTDLNRVVSLDEFKRAAVRRFDMLDTEHRGRLLLPDLQSMLPSRWLAGDR